MAERSTCSTHCCVRTSQVYIMFYLPPESTYMSLPSLHVPSWIGALSIKCEQAHIVSVQRGYSHPVPL